MRVRYNKKFVKQYEKADANIKKIFGERLKLFLKVPHSPQLRNHPLSGKLLGYRSINITGDWRALFSEVKDAEGSIMVFEMIGTHSQLYK